MNSLIQRVHRAVDSIVENEALTADLDDDAAKMLLDWGISCAKTIARSTSALNDTEAGEAMSLRLRATRRLMRSVNRWVPKRQQMDAEGSGALLTKIIEHAAVIYGEGFIPPSNDRRDAFLQQCLVESSPQVVVNLRRLIENMDRDSATDSGGPSD